MTVHHGGQHESKQKWKQEQEAGILHLKQYILKGGLNWKQGELLGRLVGILLSNATLVMYFLQQGCTSRTSPNSTNQWGPSI